MTLAARVSTATDQQEMFAVGNWASTFIFFPIYNILIACQRDVPNFLFATDNYTFLRPIIIFILFRVC